MGPGTPGARPVIVPLRDERHYPPPGGFYPGDCGVPIRSEAVVSVQRVWRIEDKPPASFLQLRREHGHNLPQEFVVEAGVIVHDPVADAGNALPRNLAVPFL
jgi:hypothetical protein